MLRLNEHIDGFEKLMNSKGYDGYFISNFGYPGKLPETIRKHIFKSLLAGKDVNPIRLSTYSKWKDDTSPYVLCDFTVKYNEEKGFLVKGMDIHHKHLGTEIRNSKLDFKSNLEIPDREQANKITEPVSKKKGRGL